MKLLYILCINQLFDFYCNSIDWLPRDARSGCVDSRNRLQVVLRVFMYVCVDICASICMCMQVWICYMYVCMCICVCVCIYILLLFNLTIKLLYVAPLQGFFSVRFSLDDIYQF